MFDDRHLRGGRILTRDRTALGALARVLQRFEIPGVPQRHCAHPDTESRLVHHVEHVDDAAVLFTDQITRRAVEVQHRVGDTALSHLVVEAGDRDLVARTDRSVRIDKELRHNEQRDALGPGRPTGDLGEHQMHDVLRHLVFGTRDPHLGSEQPVGAVISWLGPSGDIGERRSRGRLRQRHGPGESARQHRLDEGFDLLISTELGEQIGVGDRQHQIARRTDVGGREPREAGLGNSRGQLRATECVIHAHAEQIGRGDGVEGLLHLGDHGDRGSVE